jgi:hypothetical protein
MPKNCFQNEETPWKHLGNTGNTVSSFSRWGFVLASFYGPGKLHATHASRSGRPSEPFASYQRVVPAAACCLVSGIHPPDELLATEPHTSTTTGSLQLARSNSPPNRDSMEPGKPFCFRVRQVGWLYGGCFHAVTSNSLLHSLLLYTGSCGILLN